KAVERDGRARASGLEGELALGRLLELEGDMLRLHRLAEGQLDGARDPIDASRADVLGAQHDDARLPHGVGPAGDRKELQLVRSGAEPRGRDLLDLEAALVGARPVGRWARRGAFVSVQPAGNRGPVADAVELVDEEGALEGARIGGEAEGEGRLRRAVHLSLG